MGNSPSNTLTINEGDSVLLVANTTIAEGETGTVTWTITQGNQPPTVSDGSMIHLNPGLPGTYQAIATVTDNFGSSAIATTGIQVLSVPPVLSNLAITPSVYENDPVTVSGMVSEPGAGETLNVTVNWGDGASSNEQLTASAPFSLNHSYVQTGDYDVQVNVIDTSGLADSQSLSAVVLAHNTLATAVNVGPLVRRPAGRRNRHDRLRNRCELLPVLRLDDGPG